MGKSTWVVVADGGQARFFTNQGSRTAPSLKLARELEHDNPPAREQGSDRPGRFPDAGHGRSAVEDTDWHEQAEQRFVETVADEINAAALKDAFDELIIYADAASLGTMRRRLHKQALARLAHDEALNLTKTAVRQLEQRVKRVLAPHL